MSDDSERALGKIEGKLDLLLARLPVYEERLHKLEQSHAHSSGRQSVISAGVSVAVAAATTWFAKHFA